MDNITGTVSGLRQQAATPTKSTQVMTEINQQQGAVERLIDTINELEKKLTVVLNPRAEEGNASEKVASEPKVLLANALADNTGAIKISIYKLESIIDRLEL